MTRAVFIDLDETLVKKNTTTFIDGSRAAVNKILEDPENHVYFFSCRYPTDVVMKWLKTEFPKMKGFIHKPWAEEYVIIDDLLALEKCKRSLI